MACTAAAEQGGIPALHGEQGSRKAILFLLLCRMTGNTGYAGSCTTHLREMIITCGIRASLHVEAVESRDPMDGNFRTPSLVEQDNLGDSDSWRGGAPSSTCLKQRTP